MKYNNTFNSMPTYGEIEKIKELHQNQPPKQMSEEKQKAEQIVEMFRSCAYWEHNAVECAKLHVKEMIKDLNNYQVDSSPTVKNQVINWWKSVLTELNKM